jgi:hypothetical protein
LMDSKTLDPDMVLKIDNQGLKYGGINV